MKCDTGELYKTLCVYVSSCILYPWAWYR